MPFPSDTCILYTQMPIKVRKKTSKKYTLRVRAADKDIFNVIKSGKKKVETRAATSRYVSLKSGDTLIFVCGKDRFEKTIKTAKIYKTLASLTKKYSPLEINPFCKTREELEAMYFSFPGYKEKIIKSGIIAIELK